MTATTPVTQLQAVHAILVSLLPDARFIQDNGHEKAQLAHAVISAEPAAAKGNEAGCVQAVSLLKAALPAARDLDKAPGDHVRRCALGVEKAYASAAAIVWRQAAPTLTVQGFATVAVSASAPVAATATLLLSAPAAGDVTATLAVTGLAPIPVAIPAGRTSLSVPIIFPPQSLAQDRPGTGALSATVGATLGTPASFAFVEKADVLPGPSVSVAQGFDSVQLDATVQVARQVTATRGGDTGSPLQVPVRITGDARGVALPLEFLVGEDTASTLAMFDPAPATVAPLGAGSADVVLLGTDPATVAPPGADRSGRLDLVPPDGVALGDRPGFDFAVLPPGLPALALAGPGDITPSAAAETDGTAIVSLPAPTDHDVTGVYTLSGQRDGDLLGPATGPVLIPAGQASATIRIRVAPLTLAVDRPLTLALSGVAGATGPFPASVAFALKATITAKATVDFIEIIGQIGRLPTEEVARQVEVMRHGSTHAATVAPVRVAGLPAGVLVAADPAAFRAGQARSYVVLRFSPAGRGFLRGRDPMTGQADLTATPDLDPGTAASQTFQVVDGPPPPPPPPGGKEGMAPPFPESTATIVGPVPLSQVPSAYAALSAQQIAGGVTILYVPGGTLPGGLTLDKRGTADAPIIIRPGTLSGGGIVDPPSFPAGTITGRVDAKGDHNWLRGLAFHGGIYLANRATGNRLNRSYITVNPVSDTGTSTIIDWCELELIGDEFLQHHPMDGCRRPFVYRCFFHNQAPTGGKGNVGTYHSIGKSAVDSEVACGGRIYECLYGHGVTASEGGEFKCSENVMWRCSAQDVGGVGGNHAIPRNIVRHGRNNKLLALYTDATGTEGSIGCRGVDNIIADCVAPRGGPIGPFSGNNTYDGWLADKSKGSYPVGERTILCRIANPHLGGGPSKGTMAPTGTVLEDCTGPVGTQDGAAFTRRPNATDYYAQEGLPGPDVKPARSWPTSKMGPNGVYDRND